MCVMRFMFLLNSIVFLYVQFSMMLINGCKIVLSFISLLLSLFVQCMRRLKLLVSSCVVFVFMCVLFVSVVKMVCSLVSGYIMEVMVSRIGLIVSRVVVSILMFIVMVFVMLGFFCMNFVIWLVVLVIYFSVCVQSGMIFLLIFFFRLCILVSIFNFLFCGRCLVVVLSWLMLVVFLFSCMFLWIWLCCRYICDIRFDVVWLEKMLLMVFSIWFFLVMFFFLRVGSSICFSQVN